MFTEEIGGFLVTKINRTIQRSHSPFILRIHIRTFSEKQLDDFIANVHNEIIECTEELEKEWGF